MILKVSLWLTVVGLFEHQRMLISKFKSPSEVATSLKPHFVKYLGQIHNNKMNFRRESDSRIANARLSVRYQNPSASQNCLYCPMSLSTIKPIINQWAYRPSSLWIIKPIDHRAYQPSSLSSLLTIERIDHWAYQPSGLLSRLLSLSACWFWYEKKQKKWKFGIPKIKEI